MVKVKYTTHFPLSSKNHPYTVIHNLTPLEELEAFFSSSGTDFALGKYLLRCDECLGKSTDW